MSAWGKRLWSSSISTFISRIGWASESRYWGEISEIRVPLILLQAETLAWISSDCLVSRRGEKDLKQSYEIQANDYPLSLWTQTEIPLFSQAIILTVRSHSVIFIVSCWIVYYYSASFTNEDKVNQATTKTCNLSATLLNNDIARFTTHFRTALQQITLQGLFPWFVIKTRNIAVQLVLEQQCCKILLPVLPYL